MNCISPNTQVIYDLRRRRLAAPMYDVRCTTVAPGSAYVRRTMYDVRLPNLRALRGTVAADAAYVRWTMDDV